MNTQSKCTYVDKRVGYSDRRPGAGRAKSRKNISPFISYVQTRPDSHENEPISHTKRLRILGKRKAMKQGNVLEFFTKALGCGAVLMTDVSYLSGRALKI